MLFSKIRDRISKYSIRYMIFTYFTISALVAVLLIGVSLYSQMSSQLSEVVKEENQTLITQLNTAINSYLRTVMKLSDSIYYGAVKNTDLSVNSANKDITLLYDNNKDNIENIAIISKDGKILEAVPAARINSSVNVWDEPWFTSALKQTENLHFSTPKVQRIFDNNETQYKWVISMSRAVEITHGSATDQGVLLIDIRYKSLQQLLENASFGNGGYVYLISNDGEIIYHPKMQLIDSGYVLENNKAAAAYRDGNYRERFNGVDRQIIVKSVGYTGWKLIGVAPEAGISFNTRKTRLFIVFMAAFIIFLLTLFNAYISSKITNPINELEKSVNALETGDLGAEVYMGGSYEICHLGRSIKDMAGQIQVLMNDIVHEHEAKRKGEFDTLQSQINPHFLYNTLDIIVWMIENEKKADAVKAVTALARFFRISLSKGKSIITLKDELEHVRNYLMIQEMRFKNRFTYKIDAEEDVMELASLKLILQPLVENAIYHGMEFMDGDGEIIIRAHRENDSLFLSVRDNGLGMTKEQTEALLSEEGIKESHNKTKGSGIGVKNVNERIQLYFGEAYGLIIDSEPDEGTIIHIHLPAVNYEDIKEKK